ncbi:hypothetical protein [Nocardioides sp. HB32]
MTRRLVRPDMVADEGRPVGVAPMWWMAVHHEHDTVTNQCASEIGVQAALGYRLHTISTAASGSKGLGGGDRIQATMVFERLT